MAEEEGDVLYLGVEHGNGKTDAEGDERNTADADVAGEVGEDALLLGTEEDAEVEQFEVQIEDDDSGRTDEDKKDDNMLVVDDLDGDDELDDHDQDAAVTGPCLDSELSERHQILMPSMQTVMSDLFNLRRNRRISVYPLSLDEINHDDIQSIITGDSCEEVKLHMIRSSTDMKSWAGCLTLTFMTSKCTTSAVEKFKSFKEGITVKLDANPAVTVESFTKSYQKSAAWPTYWANRLLMVYGLPSETKPEELQSEFPGAEQIVVTKDSALKHPRVGRRRENIARAQGTDGYAYVIYKTEEAAKSIVQEYTDDPPVFGKNLLDVKFYREPVAKYPHGLMWLRNRKVVLTQLDMLTKNLEKSKSDASFELPSNTEKHIATCKATIERDDELRRELGLQTPTLEDYKHFTFLRPLKPSISHRILVKLGLEEPRPAPQSQTPKAAGEADKPNTPGLLQDKKKRFRSRSGGRGRGQPRGQGVRGGFGRGSGEGFGRASFSPRRQSEWGNYSSDAQRYMNRTVDDLHADAVGVMNQLARIMQQPGFGLTRSGGGGPVMSGGEGMGMPSGGGFGRGMRGLGEGRRGGHGFQPPMKMMRTDDSGRGFGMDRDLYDRDGRYDDRPMLPPQSHSTEYRAPPRRTPHGGSMGPGHGLGGGPSGYRNTGLGGDDNYDIGFLMNISKMLSQNLDQGRPRY